MKMEQRRRLTDLFSRGKEFPVLGPDGKPAVSVYVRKMTPADAEISYVKASAKRASVLALGKEVEPSEAIVTLRAQLDGFSKEDLVAWRTTTEIMERQPQVETKVAFEDEWQKDNYLMSLQERIGQSDFQTKAKEYPEDDEVVRVTGELERYQTQVNEEMAEVEKEVRSDREAQGEEDLRKAVLDAMLETQADASWLGEFQRCQVWKCVFDAENRGDPYFATREEVDQVQIEVLSQLMSFIDQVHVPDKEGKDSPQTPDS